VSAAMQSPRERLEAALRVRGCRVRARGPHKSEARCPTCDSPDYHLGIEEGPDGRALVHCIRGCPTDAVLAALGLSMADLFHEKREGSARAEPLTLAAYCAAKRLDLALAKQEGFADGADEFGRPCLVKVYTCADGSQIRRYRRAWKGDGAFGWPRGTKPKQKGAMLGRAHLVDARAAGFVIPVEGASDYLTLLQNGFSAVAFPGADMVNPKLLAKDLAGIAKVLVSNERDAGAAKFLRSFAQADGLAERVSVVFWEPFKDPSEAYLANPAGFEAFVRDAMAKARPLAEVVAGLDTQAGPQAAAQSETLARYARTDAGNGERFRDLYGNLARYVHQLETWRVWTGLAWADDLKGEVEQLALLVARDRLREAAALADDRERQEEAKWALRSESVDKRRDLLQAAATMPEFACLPGEFDRDPMLLNCENGTLDLRTGELRPHDPAAMCSKLIPVAYDPKATCPRWERFLAEVFDGSQRLADFVQRAVGYSLTGDTREQCLFLLYGGGRNGKSTFVGTLERLLGEYARHMDFGTLTFEQERRGAIRNDIARLRGARFVGALETSEGVRFAEGVVKGLTGGDRVTARFLHHEFFEFEPEFKLWLGCNHKPQVRDSSEAFWRRIRLVPFTVSFKGREDKTLADTLAAELPGILAWAVRGCLEWQEAGDLKAPAEVLAATQDYRQAEDVLAQFLADRCVTGEGSWASARELYGAYCQWCEGNSERATSQRRFGEALRERGFERRPGTTKETRGRVEWVGIGLLDSREEAA